VHSSVGFVEGEGNLTAACGLEEIEYSCISLPSTDVRDYWYKSSTNSSNSAIMLFKLLTSFVYV